jgi:predicted transcriptional regulator
MNTEESQQHKMTFVLPRTLMERLRTLAKQHHRSLTGELLVAIEQYLDREERQKGQADATR